MPPQGSSPQDGIQRSPEESGEGVSIGQEADAQAANETPDVTLDVQKLNLEELSLQVENLRARISLQAELTNMVKINVGVDAHLDNVELDLKGLEAQALMKADLNNVRDVLSQALKTLDNNPQLLENLAQTAEGSRNEMEGVAGRIGDAFQKPEDGTTEDPSTSEEGAGEIDATDAAWRKAEELGVELRQLEGTGSKGRITVKDVVEAADQE